MRYLTALLVCSFAAASYAGDPAKEVESAIEILNDAFAKQDVAKIRSLMAPNHVAITPFAGKQQLEDQLRTLPDLKYDKYSAGPMSATTVSDNCVLLTYALKVQGTYEGRPLPSNCLVTAIWVKNDGKWLELQYQETAVNENPVADIELLNELSALERQSWDATMKDDMKFFEGFLADQATGMLADGSVIGRKEIIKNLDDLHLKKYTMGKTAMLRISEDAAMILYQASYEAVHKGVQEKYSAVNCSALYVRRSGQWRQLVYQETATGNTPAPGKR